MKTPRLFYFRGSPPGFLPETALQWFPVASPIGNLQNIVSLLEKGGPARSSEAAVNGLSTRTKSFGILLQDMDLAGRVAGEPLTHN